MHFTHLIEINDPLLPLVDVLSRTQLWRGLVLRAEAPILFVPHLDACDITTRDARGFSRTLRYGDLIIQDEVMLHPQERIEIRVPAQGEIAASSLTMTIEEPQQQALFVRFAYIDAQTTAADSIDAYYDKFRHSAYQEADIDTIRLIRQMAQAGRLDSLPS